MNTTKTLSLLIALPLLASAGTVYRTGWNISSGWSWDDGSGSPPHSFSGTDNYISNTSGGWMPGSESGNTWPGASLSFQGSDFSISASNYTINDLRTGNSQTFWQGGDNLQGNWNVEGNTTLAVRNASSPDTVNIGSSMEGRGNLEFYVWPGVTGHRTFNFNGAGSTWQGSINIGLGWENPEPLTDSLRINFDNAHDLSLSTMGNLFLGDNQATSSTQTQLYLDQNFTFQNVTLTPPSGDGSPVILGSGVYTYDDLLGIPVGAGSAADFFVGSGGDSFTLNVIAVPEPSTFGLLSIGAIMLRRRFRRTQ